ncbi:ABC transporter substrate-binding protein [Photobacterium ganghwense]|uniref:ABC transporter substrate-binding protein n=1 Tax=Photobacterium ganghwense TaxID=320778 RepID=UPI0039F0270C
MKKTMLTLGLTALFSQAAMAENSLVWTQSIDIPTLDPYAFASTSALAFQNHIYEGLVQWDDNFNIAPALATAWTQVDNETIRFTLRKGVTFHNGNPFNADDVVASIERVTHPDSGIRGNASSVVSARKLSDYEVEIKTTPSSPIVLNELTGVLIMDKEWLTANNALMPSSMSLGTESFATNNANGTGPFILESRRRDAQMVLKVNDKWWNNAQKQHNIDKVVFKPVSSDATRLAGLMSGEFDITTDVPLQDLPRLEKDPKLTVKIKPSLRVDYLSFNMADSLNAKNDFDANPLKDIRVRQALVQAVNRDVIVKKIMRDMTEVANTYVAPGIAGYDASSQLELPYDPNKAKQLLKEAGYQDGFNIAFDCVQGAYINAEQWCQAVQRYWAKVGINASLNMHPRSTYSTIRDQGKTDIAVLGWANLPLIDAYSINQQLLHSKDNGIYGAFNIPTYRNDVVDTYIEQASTELDKDKRVALMAAALKQAQNDLPYMPLHFEPVAWVTSKKLSITQQSDNVVRLWKAQIQ